MKEYLKNTWDGIYTVLVGMNITFKHMFKPSVTIQYPDVKPPLPERARNRLYVNMDDCIGCDQCARACPVNCIEIETVKSTPGDEVGITSNGKKKALWVTKFDIDIAKCCYCSLCVYPCPTECIYMTDVYEFAEYKRDDFVYKFSTLSENEVEDKQAKFEEFSIKKEAEKKAAAEAKAKAAAEKAAAAKLETEKEVSEKKEEPKKDSSENEDKKSKSQNMGLYDIIFYLFAAVTIFSAVLVVTSKNVIYSAFGLMFTFFGVAGLYVLLGADFLAITQIMVYVGGILILLLFGVMMTNKITNVEIKTGTVKLIPSAIISAIFGALLISLLTKSEWRSVDTEIPFTTTFSLGKLLLTEYVLIFELLGILLLVALIGAASIARRGRE